MVNWAVSLLGDGFWTRFKDFITGIFALIPQFIYFFYTCIASVIDALQYLIRKLAGLDTYYINGVETKGDILTQLINGVLGVNGSYSALNTVFWAMIIFGLIILILGVIISIIKAHYNYDEQKARPSFIIGKALKNVALMAIVPIVTIIGIYLSNIFLKALDSVTSSSSVGATAEVFATSEGNYQTVFEARSDEWGSPTYSSYDFFGSDAPTGTVTVSGILFKASANNCNRVRYGFYTADAGGSTLDPDDGKWSDCGIFNSKISSPEEQKEAIAYMIDYAFANNLRLSDRQTASIIKEESAALVSSFRYLQSAVWYAGTIEFKTFSKFNVGLVWYYYNLWQFNFLVGFIGVIIAVVLVTSIVFGLMVRLLECTALMICLGPIIGVSPLEGGTAFGEWRKTFLGDVLTAYGAIAGMNLSFMILPYLQKLMFFSSPLLNAIVEMMLIIVLLIAIKQVIGLISGFVGGGDAAALGAGLKGDVGGAAKQGASGAASAASLAVKIMKLIPATKAAATAIENAKKKIEEAKKKALKKLKNSKLAKKISNSKPVSAARKKYEELRRKKHGGDEEDGKEGDEKLEAISEEEHDERVAKREGELNESKDENNKNIDELEKKLDGDGDDDDSGDDGEGEKKTKAKDRSADENRAEAAELNAEADEMEADIPDDIEDDFEAFLDPKVKTKDFARFMAGRGKTVSDSFVAKAQNLKYERNVAAATGKKRKNLTAGMVAEPNQKAMEEFKNFLNSQKNEAAAKRERASNLEQMAQLQDANTAIDNEIKEMHSEGFTFEGTRIKRKMLPKGIGKTLANFGGETFKAVGSSLGFDKIIKDLDKETSIIDSGRTIFKDLAKSIGLQLDGVKAFQTKSEHEKTEKRKKQEKLTSNAGKSESGDILSAVKELTKTLKDNKLID